MKNHETTKKNAKRLEELSRSAAMRIAREKKVRYDIALAATVAAGLMQSLARLRELPGDHSQQMESCERLMGVIMKKHPVNVNETPILTKLVCELVGREDITVVYIA